MNRIILFSVLMFVIACNKQPHTAVIEKGMYRAVLELSDEKILPFNFEVLNKHEITIFNADEQIKVKDISYKNDSVYIQMPVFEGYLVGKLDNGLLKGTFVKDNLNRVVPFYSERSNKRFNIKLPSIVNITGNWETVFSPNSNEDRYIAKGVFNQIKDEVTGTFRTKTGDYRFLEGVVDGNQLKLSTFDGAHAFLFTGIVTDSTINGYFYSGNHFKEPFTAKRNNTFELPNANSLTYIKDGYNGIDFSFPDTNGKQVSLKDKQFKNKVVLVQIMGTWCPNCLDESTYFSNYYNTKKHKDLEIVALAFEYVKTKEKAFNNIKRLQERLHIKYPILLAQYGSSNKVKAQEKLPMLNHVLSYPTTIFIDKKGNVRKIHTGFNGPATEEKYIAFKNEFEAFVNTLLNEK